MVKHNLGEIHEEIIKDSEEELDFWYVTHKDFEPFTGRLDYSEKPLLFIRDINEDEKVKIYFEETPDRDDFVEAVEMWLEKWERLKEE